MSDAKSLCRTALLALVASTALLVSGGEAGAAPNCKPNRATCTANHQCCSGFCGSGGLCAAPPTTTTIATTTTTTSSTTSSTTTTIPRFVDNEDGTVTDDLTGLQWEKKTGTVGGSADPNDPHNVNNTYTWCANVNNDPICDNGNIPDGTAFTGFLNTLNGGVTGVGNCVSSDGTTQTGGFNNHCDWRLPTIAELRTIIDGSQGFCGGGSGACIDPTFGPTVSSIDNSFYWSSATNAGILSRAWGVGFRDGSVNVSEKSAGNFVRAVRGGCACTGGKVLDPSGMCVCPAGQTEDGSGTCQCPSGQTKCNGNCTDTETDPDNCGTCGTACDAEEPCDQGSCVTPTTTTTTTPPTTTTTMPCFVCPPQDSAGFPLGFMTGSSDQLGCFYPNEQHACLYGNGGLIVDGDGGSCPPNAVNTCS